MATPVGKILEELDELSIEDKEFVKENFDKMYIEARREEICKNAEEAKKLHSQGRLSSFDSAGDLMNSLMEESP